MLFLGVIGDRRVGRSFSPRMHRAVMKRHGLEGCYLSFPVEPDRLGEAVAGLSTLGATGFNVTVPYKEAIIPLLDEVSEDARPVGAVNTVVRRPDGGLIGHNTDISGFMAALEGVPWSVQDGRTILRNHSAICNPGKKWERKDKGHAWRACARSPGPSHIDKREACDILIG